MAAPTVAPCEPRPAPCEGRFRFLLQARPGAQHDAFEWRIGALDVDTGLGGEPSVDSAQEAAAAGEHNCATADVGCKFGWCRLERPHDGVSDRLDRRLERKADLCRVDGCSAQEPRQTVATRD